LNPTILEEVLQKRRELTEKREKEKRQKAE